MTASGPLSTAMSGIWSIINKRKLLRCCVWLEQMWHVREGGGEGVRVFVFCKLFIEVHDYKQMSLLSVQICSNNVCMNGGICANQTGGYMCTCAAGYTGVNCETSEYLWLLPLAWGPSFSLRPFKYLKTQAWNNLKIGLITTHRLSHINSFLWRPI